MKAEFIIAEETDAKIIAVLRQKIWSTTYRGIYSDDVIDNFDYDWHEMKNLALIRDADSHVYIISCDGGAVGYFILQEKSSVYIQSLYILPEYQHMAIGSQAFGMAADYCKNHGYREFYCHCNPHNEGAVNFYKSKGGVITVRDVGHREKQEDQITFEFKDYFLQSERIGFSHWTENDFELALKLWGEPEVSHFICAGGVFTQQEIKDRLVLEINHYEAYGIQYFPIFALTDGDLIGCCGLRPYKGRTDILELGFHLRKKYWRQGFAFEATTAMIEYSFSVIGAKGLKAGHHPENIASKKLLEKLGFRYETDSYYEPTGLYHPSYYLEKKVDIKAGRSEE